MARYQRGITLVELLIVLSVMGIIMSIAMPFYKRHIIRANEAALQENLFHLRDSVDAFFADHRAYPTQLSDLVERKYLRAIPKDPMTGSTDTWLLLAPEADEEGNLAEGDVFDVRSGSPKTGLNGIPYSQW